jgi:hypothetical protein
MQFYRLFYPIIVQGILTMVTAILVIGYSWQDATYVRFKGIVSDGIG